MKHLLPAFLYVVMFAGTAFAQPCATSVRVISTKDELVKSIAADAGAKFVRLKDLIPGVVLDLRYATANNFTHTVLYHNPIACMRQAPAEALKQVQGELNKKGLGLKIYDAYRPFSVTCLLWQKTTDRRYTANPRRGSHHNRGIAADLTIIDLRTGKELDMGTGYDNFTDTAHHNFAYLPEPVLANRRLLKNIMWKHGFNFVPTEWWHYHWRDKHYDVADVAFAELGE